uniref:Ankyrin repeat domain 13 family, member D n=1 Tax=Cyprinus carpio TaxID=7962 RepID=A0A8C1MUX5_CYPCA
DAKVAAFPLHYLVWNNQFQELDRELQKKQHDMERLDPRGRTPLELSVCLGHLESTRVLLRHSADPTHSNTQGWTVLQEAVSTGDPELVQLILQYRDFRRATERLSGIPELLSKLRQARDFYVEMKWEFTSWVPLVSKVCPSDVYRVWKSGSCLRVDTTLLGFEHMTWLKGRRSYIFKGGGESSALNLTKKFTHIQFMYICIYFLKCIFRSVLSLTPGLSVLSGSRTPLQSFLGIAEQHISSTGSQVSQCASPHNPTAITAEEYFDAEFNLNGRDIGRPIELTSKVQRFKATLWLSEVHPLSLAEQVTPIIDLMAISNAHFAKLRDFITLRLPPGFPVKIEIPLFHVLNARVTFSNLCGCDEPVSSVTVQSPQGATEAGKYLFRSKTPPPLQCEVDPSVFEPPPEYTTLGPGRSEPMRDEDDNLLQFAIQQSLLDAGTESDQVTIWEALTNTRPVSQPPLYEEDSQLERAIQESLSLSLAGGESVESDAGEPLSPSDPALISPPSYSSLTEPRPPGAIAVATSFDEQLRIAMELSCREQEELDRYE